MTGEWLVGCTPQARRDARKPAAAGLRPRAEALLEIPRRNPYANPPRFEKLVGDLEGAISRRINTHHRLVHQVVDGERIVKVLQVFTHYECSIAAGA